MSHALRKATADDQASIEALIARSIRTLGANDYSPQQIESALHGAFGVDSQLIRDGTYFVVEAEGRIIGCGGWSRRRTLFGSDANAQRDATELDPRVDAARIRAFFVDPAYARKGIGRAILERCEAEARSCGFSRFELMATLPGVPLYRACGYVAGDAVEHALEPELAIRFVPMRKVASDNGAMTVLRIATRKSPLALWQSEHVASRLRAAHPGLEVVLVPLSTRGDEVLDRSLSAIGGKGLFLKELEVAMLRGEADCAVHSLKDVPMVLDGPFVLPAILERADHADAFVSNTHAGIDDLPRGARVGTSSLRRQAQLRARRPDLVLSDLRGNVNTRLAKLDAGDYDAIVLACAGLQRLGFGDRIRLRLDAPDWLPAPAQGAIAIECRDDATSVRALCVALDDVATRACVEAERAMNRALHGSCHVPVAALARQVDGGLWLQGMVGSADDGRLVRSESVGDAPESLGNTVAQRLLEGGAAAFLPMQAIE